MFGCGHQMHSMLFPHVYHFHLFITLYRVPIFQWYLVLNLYDHSQRNIAHARCCSYISCVCPKTQAAWPLVAGCSSSLVNRSSILAWIFVAIPLPNQRLLCRLW